MAEVWLVSVVDLVKVTTHMERDSWDRLKNLPGPENKPNASYHLREAVKLYLRVLDREKLLAELPKIIEEIERSKDQRPDESIHASSIG